MVSHRGDWDGDGDEDVVARTGDQLLLHRNTGTGGLEPGVVMKVSETGWAHASPVAAGDIDGDGGPDVLATSSAGLWLHRGRVAADGGWLSFGAVRIGPAEWKDREVLASGDTDGDGRAEVWARGADGTIEQYGYDSATKTLGAPTALGSLPRTSRPLGLSLGDVDGDGHADLWTTTAAADLVFHPGGAPFAEAGGVSVGTGGWGYFSRLGRPFRCGRLPEPRLFRAHCALDTLGMHDHHSEWKVCGMEAMERRRAAADRVRTAEDAVEQLREGLAGFGVKLPSLRIDPVSCAGDEPAPLVDLGRCNIDTALRLCEVLAEKESGHDG